jgi:hypothetical protein
MNHSLNHGRRLTLVLSLLLSLVFYGCGSGGGGGGGGRNGAAISANPQSITFSTTPSLPLNGTATVTAVASSGLPIRYSSKTPNICTVDESSGLTRALRIGNCVIAANQGGNSSYAQAAEASLTLSVHFDPNQTISFDTAPALSFGGTAAVIATASSGLAVVYSALTPSVCSVDTNSGLVTDLTVGSCIVAADQAGDATYRAAPQATLTLVVTVPVVVTVPGIPSGVTATLGAGIATVIVTASSIDSGGNPITGYTVTSSPAGISVSATSLPITVTCPSSCAGYAFSLAASNGVGNGAASAAAHILARYNVTETFYEPDTQPRDSIFVGSFTYDFTSRTVSSLKGQLSESMTGDLIAYPNDTMTWLDLDNQLQSWYDAGLGGTFAVSFKNTNTNTFSTMLGGDGWSPQAGVDVGGIYHGFPAPANNPGNAYALIFVPDNPTDALTQAQINKLAYADCAPGGMMGAVCMTGTSVAGYGAVGTMSGYPVSQVITRQ